MPAHYERLSYLDNSFLALEARNTHMHVAGIAIFEVGPLETADGGIDKTQIRGLIESKLPMIPRYRQRLAWVPVEKHPVWVDDEDFDIDYHVRHFSLPRPGTFEQLKELIGIMMSQQLDRSKPLWEFNVIEGLEGDRFAVVSKIHHCMIDGIAGVDLMAVLLSLTPAVEVQQPEPFVARPAPSGSELVVRETARRTARALSAMKSVRQLGDDTRELIGKGAQRSRAAGYSLASGWLTRASKTPLNGKVGAARSFGTLTTPLDEVKEIKNRVGGSVNDVILGTVAGGVRRWLTASKDFEVDDLDFRVMAPVSVRAEDQRGTLGNHVAMWLVALPVSVADPLERLRAVQEATKHLKETNQALGAATLVRMSAGAPATLVSMASRLAAGVRPFNMTVTNVPGPQFPLYLLGSQMETCYPVVNLLPNQGLGVALFSYAGKLFWGIVSDWYIVRDLHEFVLAVEAAFAELAAVPPSRVESRSARRSQPGLSP